MKSATRFAYLDTSAFVKLFTTEPELPALSERLLEWPLRASADLLLTEMTRALRRLGRVEEIPAATEVFNDLTIVDLKRSLLSRAADLNPPTLRTLDAIHLAAALSLGADLGAIFTYDARLRDAALSHGISVESPGVQLSE